MFSDEILEKIFSDPDARRVPIGYQSTIVHVVEKVLEEIDVDEFQSIRSDL